MPEVFDDGRVLRHVPTIDDLVLQLHEEVFDDHLSRPRLLHVGFQLDFELLATVTKRFDRLTDLLLRLRDDLVHLLGRLPHELDLPLLKPLIDLVERVEFLLDLG